MKWPDHDEPPACSRLQNWLSSQDTLRVKYFKGDESAATRAGRIVSQLDTAAQQLRTARRPLIWLESADASAVRAAVMLAETIEATVHVAQSPGGHHVARMLSSYGMLGTSLAEMRTNASLVVHVGQQHLRNMPMIPLRFTGDADQLFIAACPTELFDTGLAGERIETPSELSGLNWPRDQWLDLFSRTLLAIRDDSAAIHRPADRYDASVAFLAEALLASRSTVIVWDEDEFSDESDQLIVERLRELAEQVSQFNRCSLLPLAQDAGRVMAKDALLWLTNRSSPTCFRNQRWSSVDMPANMTLDQWRAAYDWILCIRSLPSDRPLPEVAFDLVLDVHCNIALHDQAYETDPSARSCIDIAAVGIDTTGHLLRADHGLAAYVRSLSETGGPHNSQRLPSAAELLKQLNERLRASDTSRAVANGSSRLDAQGKDL